MQQADGDVVSFGTGLGGRGAQGQFLGHPGFHHQTQLMPWHNFLSLAHLPEANKVMGATHGKEVCMRQFRIMSGREALAGDTPSYSDDGENIQQRDWSSREGTTGREEWPSVGGREAGAWSTDSPALGRRGDDVGGDSGGGLAGATRRPPAKSKDGEELLEVRCGVNQAFRSVESGVPRARQNQCLSIKGDEPGTWGFSLAIATSRVQDEARRELG